ncbi:MAG: hypothetical protein ABSB95_04175 [Dissulfurispiraceae bacterium]|jgi:hypothetical protein
MSRHILRKIVSILRESPLYRSLSAEEKRSIIKGLTDNYSFLHDGNNDDIVGYESSWAEIIENRH